MDKVMFEQPTTFSLTSSTQQTVQKCASLWSETKNGDTLSQRQTERICHSAIRTENKQEGKRDGEKES